MLPREPACCVLHRLSQVKSGKYRLPWRKAQHLVLLRPFGGQVSEAGNPHAMRSRPLTAALTRSGCK
jgi:hypothetical protein